MRALFAAVYYVSVHAPQVGRVAVDAPVKDWGLTLLGYTVG